MIGAAPSGIRAQSQWSAIMLAIAWGLFAVGLATFVLFSASSVRILSSSVHGGSADTVEMVEIAEQLRAFTVGSPSEVPLDPSGINGMNRSALDHLLDVRAIVRIVGAAVSALGTLLFVATLWVFTGEEHAAILARSLRWAGVGVVATVAVLGIIVAMGFERFFITFHEVLFAGGNWMFSADSLLIRTFPEPFWIASAVGWLGVVVVFAALMLLGSAGARRLATRRVKGGSSDH